MSFVKPARGVAVVTLFVAVSLLLGSCCGRGPVKQPASPVWSLDITPVEDTNPTKTQHTFIVTVYDRDGRPIPNIQVHWILARTGDAVGDIVAYDDQDLGNGGRPLTRKTDNQYAVSYTNDQPAVLNRGNWWIADESMWTDFEVGVGQTWCTITSPVEGDSHMIAYVPAIDDATQHKVFAIKHWQRVPHLTLTKECVDQAMIGTEYSYRITVANDGEGPTPGSVQLMDALPEGLTIMDGTTFPMDLGVMKPGDVKTVTFRVRADTVGLKVNTAEARAGEFVARDDCTTNVFAYGIDLVKECSGRYNINDMVPFSLRVTNTESATLTNVVVMDPLPAGMEFVSADAMAGRASVGADGRTVTWEGFNLPGGSYADLTITTRATQKGTFTNTAAVDAVVEGTDIKVSDRDDCTVEVVGTPKLNIEKVCEPTQVGLGEMVGFRILVWNSGGADATGVTVTDLLPAGFTAMGETSWYIDVLPPTDRNGGRTFNLSAKANEPGSFTNTAVAAGAGLAEVRDSCQVQVIPPVLTIRKECRALKSVLDDVSVVNRLEKAIHTITVQNGGSRAENVIVVDTIPLDSMGRERIRYNSSNPAGNYDPSSHTITWNLGTMDANASAVIEIEFTGRTVGPAINTASVRADGFPGAQDECRLFVLGNPAFQESVLDALNGDVDADNFIVNQPFDYIVLVQNEGEADLKVDLTFSLTEELALESSPIGFVPSESYVGQPSQRLQVTEQGGVYKIESFNLSPRSKRYIKIPVRGIRPTGENAAEINIDIVWQLWYEGRLLPRQGKIREGETTVIDPE